MAGDYYEILGVPKSASEQDIKKAFRKKAAELHPDRNKDPKATEEFKKVNEAYQILSDPQKRKTYDQYGSAAFDGSNPFAQGGFGGNGQQFQVDFSELFGEGFETIFGDSPFGDIFGGGRQRQNRNRGNDIQLSIEIPMSDVISGPEKTIKFKKKEKCSHCHGTGGDKVETCRTCQGTGRIKQVSQSILGNIQVMKECNVCNGTGKEILEKCKVCNGNSVVDVEKEMKIRIPAGIEDRMNLRFTGEGDAGKFDSPAGDLFIEIRTKDELGFKREGDNLIKNIPVTIYSLVLGDKFNIDTFDGVKQVEIKQGQSPKEKIILKNLGIPNLRSKNRGSIILDLDLEMPKRLTKEQKQLFEKLKELDRN